KVGCVHAAINRTRRSPDSTSPLNGYIASGVARPSIVLADAAYGNTAEFRKALRGLRLRIGVGIQANTNMWRADKTGARRGPQTCAQTLGEKAHFKRVTWAAGTKKPLTAKFAFLRVVVARDELTSDGNGDAMW